MPNAIPVGAALLAGALLLSGLLPIWPLSSAAAVAILAIAGFPGGDLKTAGAACLYLDLPTTLLALALALAWTLAAWSSGRAGGRPWMLRFAMCAGAAIAIRLFIPSASAISYP